MSVSQEAPQRSAAAVGLLPTQAGPPAQEALSANLGADLAVPCRDVSAWHTPGVHRVRLADRDVWVRMDARGIAAVSSDGPQRLAPPPLD